eukprot:11998140-Ditylum_brightwellii.AAC.1
MDVDKTTGKRKSAAGQWQKVKQGKASEKVEINASEEKEDDDGKSIKENIKERENKQWTQKEDTGLVCALSGSYPKEQRVLILEQR